MSSIKRGKISLEILQTYFASLFLFILAVFVTRYVAQNLGTEGFGRFQMARRVVSYSFPVFICGVHISIVRALALVKDNLHQKSIIFFGGLFITGLAVMLSSGLLMFFPRHIDYVIFHGDNAEGGEAILWLLIATLIYMHLYSIYRGTQRIVQATMLLVIVVGIIPLIYAVFAKHLSDYQLIKAIGLTTLPFTLSLLALEAWRIFPFCTHRTDVMGHISRAVGDLTSYGSRRMLVPLIIGGIFTFGPIILNHSAAYNEAGLYFASLVVVRIFDQLIGPVAVVMLPRLSEMVGRRDMQALSKYTNLVIGGSLEIGCFLAMQGLIYAEILLKVWFGDDYIAAAFPLRIMMFAFIPILFFSLSQTIIDAVTHRGVILKYSSFTLLLNILLIVFLKKYGAIGVAISVLVSFWILSIFIYLYIEKEMNVSLKCSYIIKIIAVNIALVGVNFIFIDIYDLEKYSYISCLFFFMISFCIYVILSKLSRFMLYEEFERFVLDFLSQKALK